MPEKNGLLERMRVASPCPASWASMEGDERVRFCRECSLHVYNLSEMTRGEAEALVARTEGRLCGRFYRRADGTVITKDCPRGLRALRRRVARRAGAALAAVLALAGGAFGQRQGGEGGQQEQQTCAGGVTYTLKREAAGGRGPAFSGRVVDPNGAVIAGADVLLYGKGRKPKYGAATSDEGFFEIKGLAPGDYRVEIQSPGFRRFRLARLTVGAGEALRLELTLTVADETVTVVVGGLTFDPLTDEGPGLRHVFTREQIKRLPY